MDDMSFILFAGTGAGDGGGDAPPAQAVFDRTTAVFDDTAAVFDSTAAS